MKTATMNAQIDTLLSTVFQPNVPAENAVECVDRLLSAVTQIGRETHRNERAFGTLMVGEDWLEN